MLFILFGGTLEAGFQSRKILQSKGFEVIKKFNFIEENSPISSDNYKNPKGIYKDWFDDKIYVSREQYQKCDFKYQLNGVSVGFNQQQIMDAIHGVTDSILTIGADAIEFVEQLKQAYGGYVTLINLYIDNHYYRKMVSAQPGITSAEYQARKTAGKEMQKTYLKYYNLFDEVVIYTGEDTVFNLKSLELQFDQIIHRRKKLEKILNARNYVQLPYIGPEPYVFVSYSHKNKTQVYPILGMLQRNGFRIWYDEGISGGVNWRLMIKDRIKSSECVLLFSSADAVKSTDITIEITTADNFSIPIICAALDESKFDETIEEVLRQKQKLNYAVDFDYFENKVIEALPDKCRVESR